MTRPVIYVVVDKSLNMSPGKLAAQVGHAVALVMAAAHPYTAPKWVDQPHRWMIILEARDGYHLHAIERYLAQRHVPSHVVIDEGVNETPPLYPTVLGVGILDKDSEDAKYLSGLPKYSVGARDISDWGFKIDPRFLNRRGRKAFG